jgi:hypothetical protein
MVTLGSGAFRAARRERVAGAAFTAIWFTPSRWRSTGSSTATMLVRHCADGEALSSAIVFDPVGRNDTKPSGRLSARRRASASVRRGEGLGVLSCAWLSLISMIPCRARSAASRPRRWAAVDERTERAVLRAVAHCESAAISETVNHDGTMRPLPGHGLGCRVRDHQCHALGGG